MDRQSYIFTSERTEQVMGRIPQKISRMGLLVMAIVLGGIIAGSFYLEYPRKVICQVYVITGKDSGGPVRFRGEVDSDNVLEIEKGQTVNIRMNSYPFTEYGFLHGEIVEVCRNDRSGIYEVIIGITENSDNSKYAGVEIIFGMKGTAEIIVSKEKLFRELTAPYKKARGIHSKPAGARP
ncbi:MAG: hypothetical protein LUF87_10000 [Alistipes sp.]|nr:hypothetical protein [Alistipes sp.]